MAVVCVTDSAELLEPSSVAAIIAAGISAPGGGQSPAIGTVLGCVESPNRPSRLFVFVRPKVHALGEPYPETTKREVLREVKFYSELPTVTGVLVPGIVLPGAPGLLDLDFLARIRQTLASEKELWITRELCLVQDTAELNRLLGRLATANVTGVLLHLDAQYQDSAWLKAALESCAVNGLRRIGVPLHRTGEQVLKQAQEKKECQDLIARLDGVCECKIFDDRLSGRLLEWRQCDVSCEHFGGIPWMEIPQPKE